MMRFLAGYARANDRRIRELEDHLGAMAATYVYHPTSPS
jgi:hypothetical protein